MKNIPKKIYLQVGEDTELLEGEDFKDLEEVSWCQNKIHPNDIEYNLVEGDAVEKGKIWDDSDDRKKDYEGDAEKEQGKYILTERKLRKILASFYRDVDAIKVNYRGVILEAMVMDWMNKNEIIENLTPENKSEKEQSEDEGITRNPDTLYTYYRVELTDCFPEWDETICETLEEVLDILKMVDADFDDYERKAKASVTGIAMSAGAFEDWKNEFNPNNHE